MAAVCALARGQPGQQRSSLAELMQQRESGTLHAFPVHRGGTICPPESTEASARHCMPGLLHGNPLSLAARHKSSGRDVSPVRLQGVLTGPAMLGEVALHPGRDMSPFQRQTSPRREPLFQQLPKGHQRLHIPRGWQDTSLGLPLARESSVREESQQIQRDTSPVRQEPNKLQSTLTCPSMPCRGDVALQAMSCEPTPVGTSQSATASAASGGVLDLSRTKISSDYLKCAVQPLLQQTTRPAQHDLTKLSSLKIQVPGLPREGKLGLVLRGTSIVAVNTPLAAQLGFAPGYRLLAINGSSVSESQDLSRVISACLAAGPAIFDLVVSQPTFLPNQSEVAAPHQISALPGVHRTSGAIPEVASFAAVSSSVSAFPQRCREHSPSSRNVRQTSPLRSQATAGRDSSPTRRFEPDSRQQPVFMQGRIAGVEAWAADMNHSAGVIHRKPSLPSPDEMLEQVLSDAAGVCLPSFPRSDLQHQKCGLKSRASSPTRQQLPRDLAGQPLSDLFAATNMSALACGFMSKKEAVGASECMKTSALRPEAVQGNHDFTSELLQPTSNSGISSTVAPSAPVGSASIEQSSVAFSASSAKCSAEIGGLGFSSCVASNLPASTGAPTPTRATPLLSSGARLLAGGAADCLPNVGLTDNPTGDLTALNTAVPSKACWQVALTPPSEAGLAYLPAGEAADQGNKAFDAQLEVARMAEQAHRDGWLPEQAQQHVAWMAEQTMLGMPLEAAM